MTQFNFGMRVALPSYTDQCESRPLDLYMPLTSKYAYALFVSDVMTVRVDGETFCL